MNTETARKSGGAGHRDNQLSNEDSRRLPSMSAETRREPRPASAGHRSQTSVSGVIAPDGGWGWVIVLSAFMIHLVADGASYSFGVFVQPFIDDFHTTRTEIGWLGSILIGVTCGTGPLASALTNRFGCRAVVIAGTIISAVALLLSLFSPSIWFMYFTFGVALGIGYGLMYLPSVIAVSYYFQRKRACAVGLSVCGAGVGTFILAPMTRLLIDEYGWRGAVLVESGLILNGIVCGAVMRPLKPELRFHLEFDSKPKRSCNQNHMNNFISPVSSQHRLIQGAFVHHWAVSSSLELSSRAQNISGSNSDEWVHTTTSLSSSSLPPTIPRTLQNFQTSGSPSTRAVLCNASFVIFSISTLFASIGFCVPYVFVPDRATGQGVSDELAALLLSVIGISNTVSRVVFGYVSDFRCVNRFALFNSVLVLCGITAIMSALCVAYSMMIVYCMLIGTFLGIYTCLEPIVLVDLMGSENLSLTFGVSLLFGGIGAVLGPPMAGWIYDATLDYNYSFHLMGGSLVISGILLCFIPFVRNVQQSRPPATL